MGEGWFRNLRGSCDILLAALGPDVHPGLPIFLMAGLGVFVFHNSDWDVSSVPIVGDSGLILARRVDTWGDPYTEGVGIVSLI